MNSAYLFVIISVLCSVSVAHVLRYAKKHFTSVIVVITVNYAIAALVALFQANLEGLSVFTLISGCITGILFIANFYIYAESVKENGIGASVAAMRTSLIIPVGSSVLFFNESLEVQEILAGIIIVVSMYLLQSKTQESTTIQQKNRTWLLLILFVLSGLADFSAKLFHENKSGLENPYTFMFIVFTVSFITGMVFLLKEKRKIQQREILTGIALGIPNLFSSIFLIQALANLPAVIVYPFANIAVIVFGTLLGYFYWKDKLQQKQWFGIGLAVSALIILIR